MPKTPRRDSALDYLIRELSKETNISPEQFGNLFSELSNKMTLVGRRKPSLLDLMNYRSRLGEPETELDKLLLEAVTEANEPNLITRIKNRFWRS